VRGIRRTLTIVVLGTCAGCAWVRDLPPVDDRPTIDVSIGQLGILDEDSPVRYGVEYRWRPGPWSIAPGVGFIIAEDDARYVYGDLHRDFPLGEHWVTTLSFGGGLFWDGDDVELGHRVEFQSGVEVGRWFGTKWRAGLGFYHLSNGGLSEENPGTELLVLLITVPVGSSRSQSDASSSTGCPDAASCASSSRRISSPASAR
jgi:hypothetical protein